MNKYKTMSAENYEDLQPVWRICVLVKVADFLGGMRIRIPAGSTPDCIYKYSSFPFLAARIDQNLVELFIL